MTGMEKKFGKTYRLQADSLEEISGDYERVILELSRVLRYEGRKMRPGPFLNALVLWFVELPEDERERVAREAVSRLEEIMAGEPDDDPAPPAPTAMIPVAVRDETEMHKRMLDDARGKRPKGKGPKGGK